MAATPTPVAVPPVRRWAGPPAVAAHTGIAESTLATWRCRDPQRLPFHRIGRKIIYDLNEVDAKLAGQPVGAATR